MEKTLKEQQELCILKNLRLTLEILNSRNIRKVDNSDVLTILGNDIDTLEKYFKAYSNKATEPPILVREEREKKYKRCEENGGHEYREDTYKWGSTTRMSCISCGKTIE